MGSPAGMGWWLPQVGRYPLLSPALELELARAIQDWRTHPDGLESCPPAVRRRGMRARERFIQANLRLVIKVASRFKSYTTPDGFNDLVQAGNIGLCDAVERFDPTRGYRFSTYAYFWIQMRVTGHLERHERTIRLPTSITYRVSTIPKVMRRLLGELGREPTRADLAEALKMTEEEIDRIFLLGGPCASLDAQIQAGDGGTTLGELVAAPEPPPEDDEQVAKLRQQLEQLPADLRTIVESAHGIGQPPERLGHIAQRLGMSRPTVARKLLQAEHELRAVLNPTSRPVAVVASSYPMPPRQRCHKRRQTPGQMELLIA